MRGRLLPVSGATSRSTTDDLGPGWPIAGECLAGRCDGCDGLWGARILRYPSIRVTRVLLFLALAIAGRGVVVAASRVPRVRGARVTANYLDKKPLIP